MPSKYLYLLLNFLILVFPLAWSFESRMSYVKKWKFLFPSILLVMLLFIPWDIAFTHAGIWGFNSRYLLGWNLFGLPLEEWLFFVTVPYSCVFIYESVKELSPWELSQTWTFRISNFLLILMFGGALVFYSQWYTAVTFVLTGIFVFLAQYLFRFPFLGRVYISYAFVLLPFFVFNGILTGTGIDQEVVWYNNKENLGFRILTIPIEDVFYGFLLVALNTSLYLRFQGREA